MELDAIEDIDGNLWVPVLSDDLNEMKERNRNLRTAQDVHGHWEDKPTGRYGAWQSWCSVCGKHSGIGGIEKNRHRAYCPNCGAEMMNGGNNDV